MVRPTMIALWSVLLLAVREGNDPGTNRAGEASGRQAPPLPTVSLGTEHGCGLAAGGQAYCWGSNRLGQLGDDRVTSVAATVASAVPVATSQSFTTISAGANHTCAITAVGEAYCWGLNLTGELAQRAGRERMRRISVQSASGASGDERAIRYGLRGFWPYVRAEPGSRALLGAKRSWTTGNGARGRQVRRHCLQRDTERGCLPRTGSRP